MFWLIFQLLLLFYVGTNVMGSEENQPNIILMNMDDIGWGDLGVMGHPAKETPNLDKLASEGILFTEFYTAAAICSPSRASLLTGRLPLRNGFYQSTYPGRNAYTPQEMMGGIPDTELLISELLSEAGYRTKLVGKWHLGHQPQFHPLRHGFQEWFGAPNCHFVYEVDWHPGPNVPVYDNEEMIGRYYEEFEIDVKQGLSNFTLLLMDHAKEYILRADSRPYFLYWTPDSTHAPTYSSHLFIGKSQRSSHYGDAVMELDWAVGKIVELVKKTESSRDTLIIFTSDNGAEMEDKPWLKGSNGPLLCGKQTTFEGGMRTPTIAWWNKRTVSKVSHDVGSHMDLFPTFADLAGITIPDSVKLDGQTLAPILLSNEGTSPEHPVFFYRGNLLYAVRHKQYKVHYWTWTTSEEELAQGKDLCPGVSIENVTTTDIRDHTDRPVIFHILRDPGERFPLEVGVDEYQEGLEMMKEVVEDHMMNMVPAEPQLEWCDQAVMNWAPPGCERLGKCQEPPVSNPYMCFWPH